VAGSGHAMFNAVAGGQWGTQSHRPGTVQNMLLLRQTLGDAHCLYFLA